MEIELSIVMPCLNEAETITSCIEKAKSFLYKNKINGEIIIGDNGSVDGSQKLAIDAGAQVVTVNEKGYGNATREAIKNAKGKYIITADTDDSHDLLGLMPFLEKLRQGNDLVMGNRFKGEKIPEAMSFLHRYIGNPILSGIGNVFFKTKVGDFHCGLRGMTTEAYKKMDLRTSGMEFASEIVVKASLNKLKIAEVPTTVYPSGRSRKPHLRSFPDGWRHLRFLLLYSPKWLFLLPGIFIMILGLFVTIILLYKDQVDMKWLPLSIFGIIVGFQFCLFYALTKIYAINHRIVPKPENYSGLFKFINLEKGLTFGSLVFVLGVFGIFYSYLNCEVVLEQLKISMISSALLAVGVQIILFSFFFSVLGLGDKS
ncbi:glycosyltransferase family 2 protein [uncultured Algibacter sp.]|uniref:glycosyltransferase family 2 protein n=1 Tax=uncultured Algibacter sp. TaxID=298659 RepID=UPI0026373F8A|nr:glycosyltransferase family 2 protein [uncultured Algibacter sp.]